jgi:hypothetical protein
VVPLRLVGWVRLERCLVPRLVVLVRRLLVERWVECRLVVEWVECPERQPQVAERLLRN